MSQVIPDPLRPVEKYTTSPRCANCPHSKMMHIQTGKCIQCDCRGFEADPVPEAVVDAKTGEEVQKELLPIIPDSEGDPPRTDYETSKSLEASFLESLKTTGVPMSTDVRQQMGTPLDLSGQPFKPSWVPDFNASVPQYPISTRYGETVPGQITGEFKVSTATQTSATAPRSPLEKSDVLLNSHHGAHYHGMAIEPIQVIEANGMGYHEGAALKYIMRWRVKDGLDDLKKARFYIDRLIEIEEGRDSKDDIVE